VRYGEKKGSRWDYAWAVVIVFMFLAFFALPVILWLLLGIVFLLVLIAVRLGRR
jgi:4-hydroxybenzoate polyprenyltransferase